MHAAIRAPAIAQPTPIPAVAPFDKPFEDEDWLGLGFEDEDDWLSAVAVKEPVVLAVAADADELIPEDGFEELVDVLDGVLGAFVEDLIAVAPTRV